MALNSKELNCLKAGLLSIEADQGTGIFVGITMARIAEEMTARRALAGDLRPIGQRTINYYVSQIRKAGGAPQTRPRKLGRPKADTPKIRTQQLSASLWREMVRLTGVKPKKLFEVLSAVLPHTLPSQSVFYAKLSSPTWQGSVDGFSPPSRRSTVIDWLNRYCIRINAFIIEDQNTHSYWVVLAGFEMATGYLDISVLEVCLPDARPKIKQRGRPRKPPSGPAKVFIQRDGDMLTFQLAPTVLADFSGRMLRALGLPIRRVEINQHLLSVNMTASVTNAATEHATALSEVTSFYAYGVTPKQYLPYRVKGLSLDELRRTLGKFSQRYYARFVAQQINAERHSLLEHFKKCLHIRKRLFVRLTPSNLRLSELLEHYLGKPPVFNPTEPNKPSFEVVRGDIDWMPSEK